MHQAFLLHLSSDPAVFRKCIGHDPDYTFPCTGPKTETDLQAPQDSDCLKGKDAMLLKIHTANYFKPTIMS